MKYVEYAKRRFDAALQEIERLRQSEFPYDHIQDVLLRLEAVFQRQRAQLDKLIPGSSPAIAKNACSQSLIYLFNYTPFLGFVLRATNVRNAFELYPPLLRLARKLLGINTKLVLSSEWDYSPFVYLPTNELPDCVLIGVPAFESSNPLLIALAGHELGHNVWNQRFLANKFDAPLRHEVMSAVKGKFWSDFVSFYPQATHATLTTDMFVQQAWLPAHTFAIRQIEEVFCDMMGLRLFGEAYLHAFAYLLAPCIPGERPATYPEISARVAYMMQGASKLGLAVPTDYVDSFDKQLEPANPLTKMLVAIADVAVGSLIDRSMKEAFDAADGSSVPQRSDQNITAISRDFEKVMPCEGAMPLTDIINAGWQLVHKSGLWKDVPQIRTTDRTRVLNDLVLKSCEVAEYTERLSAP